MKLQWLGDKTPATGDELGKYLQSLPSFPGWGCPSHEPLIILLQWMSDMEE